MYDIQRLLTNNAQSPVFFIAELGINHDGNINIAKQMIDVAVLAKADGIKFQIYNLDGFYNQQRSLRAYELFKKFHISFEDFLKLKEYSESQGVLAFATPLDEDTLHHLIQEKIFPIKIASGDATTEPWLDILIDQAIPFIISTGSLEDTEIQQLVNKIRNSLSALLYCISEYPTPINKFDLNYLYQLKQYLPNQIIGFSDHSQGITLSLGAIAKGAKIIERHFTITPNRKDFDHPVSLSPEQFSQLVTQSRILESALGQGNRIITNIEKRNRPHASRDAYAKIDIPLNTKIQKKHIILQRPGIGITTKDYNYLLQQTTNNFIPKGTKLLDIFPRELKD